MATPDEAREVRLFPLRAVLFPDGLLSLKVFEARYLALITECAQLDQTFGAVAWIPNPSSGEVRETTAGRFESVGTLAQVLSAESSPSRMLVVRCRGSRRFRILATRQHSDGLWSASVTLLPADEALAPAPALVGAVRALATAISKLSGQTSPRIARPYLFDDAGWVANRWCEMLPIPQTAKQRLMELPDPMVRLQLVNDFLRQQGVLGASRPGS